MMDTAPLIDVQSEGEKGNEETDDGRCGYVHADPALSYPLLDGVPERPGFTADDSNSSYFDQNSSAAVKSLHSASGASALAWLSSESARASLKRLTFLCR